MLLDPFVLAAFASIDSQHRLNLIGIFHYLSFPEFPAVCPSLTIAGILHHEIGDERGISTITLAYLDPDGRDLNLTMDDSGAALTRGGIPDSTNLYWTYNRVPFAKPGDYQFKLLVNGVPLATRSLKVWQDRPNRGRS